MKKYIFPFLFLIFGISGYAQNSNSPKIDQYEIESEIYSGTRYVSVSTPVGYNPEDKNTKYLVAYLFDGQFTPYFNMVSSTIQYYSQIGDGVPMIVISIHTSHRSIEFTPLPKHEKTTKGWNGKCGEAASLTKFIKEEVIPQVESKYNILPYRLGIGHSLGGTYVMTELFNDESLFKGVIAVSPNMVYDEEHVVEQGMNYFKKNPNSSVFVYCSAGDQGKMENNFRWSLEKLNEDAKINGPQNMIWEYEFLPDDTHMSTFLPTFDNGYLKFSKKWMLTEAQSDEIAQRNDPVKGFHQFYADLSKFASFEFSPTNDDYNNFAYTLDYFKKHAEAISILDEAILLFPEDANLHDSRGEMYEKSGKEKEAHACYNKAIEILESNKEKFDEEDYEYFYEIFKTNADRTAIE